MANQKSKAGANPALVASLQETARQILAENGEKPDRWLIAAHQNEDNGRLRILCATPQIPTHPGYNGPLLEQIFANNLALALYLTADGQSRELHGIACVSLGFLANQLAENSFNLETDFKPGALPEDFPHDFSEVVIIKRQPELLPALRAALKTMLQLGYHRVVTPFAPPSTPNARQSLEIAVKKDGSVALGAFQPEATFGDFSEILAKSAARAKLTRLRQTAKNCGGCGRCCHDAEIPLTYFDVKSVAAHRFAELHSRQPETALAQTHKIMAATKPPLPGEPPKLTSAPRLYFRKKDGTSDGGSPCIFLDGRGLCGVYEGRPMLCRLYHCAISSLAVELLFNSAFNSVEWLGRAIESGFLRPELPLTLPLFFEQPLLKLASPYAFHKVAQELKGLGELSQTNRN